MKHLLLTLLLVSLTSATALADSPEAILKDYDKQAAKAIERLNQSLEKTATPMITKLVQQGDTAGAQLLTSQLKSKLAGEPVEVPQASAAQLFTLYDQARSKALAPIQKSSIARIDAMLKTAGGAKLETITELGKVRERIDGGVVSATLPGMPLVWDYFTGSDRRTKQAEMIFKPNGTVSIVNAERVDHGKWAATVDPKVFSVTLLDTAPTEEKCLFKIMGNDAELERPIGTRYLRVKP